MDKRDKRIFDHKEIDSYASGWVVDLGPENIVNPDFFWYFNTKRQAVQFARLVDAGTPPEEAEYIVKEIPLYARFLGRLGGATTSARKAEAARKNGRKGGRPKK